MVQTDEWEQVASSTQKSKVQKPAPLRQRNLSNLNRSSELSLSYSEKELTNLSKQNQNTVDQASTAAFENYVDSYGFEKN